MELIVAVYGDWGIGCGGTQPLALKADRRFFREITKGATVIVGRKTAEDFPGGKPLPGRKNLLLTASGREMPGFFTCRTLEEAVQACQKEEKVFVIGGGSVYRALLPYCSGAYVTKLSASPESDTFFPNLDEMEGWYQEKILGSGTENGISYRFCRYLHK